MKNFYKKLVCYLISLIALCVLIFVGVIQLLPAQFDQTYQAALNDKYEYLLSASSPKVIFISGSSGGIGINSMLAERELGVPFVNLPGNVFLPFMGIVLQDVYRKQLVKADKMMPATQMVFLELLYMSDEESVLKSEVANKLNLTKTSITRATAQLEEMGLIQQMKSGTEIAIKRNYSRKEYYENAKGYLINPVQKVITIMRYEATFESFSAGETALSQESELNPPRIEERAIYKGEEVVDQLEIVDARSEDPDDCLKIQLWKYNPSYFARERRVDPVSLACTFKGNEDERIEMSIEELLEEL